MRNTYLFILVAILVFPIGAYGFFSDLQGLQTELITWQATHNTDFSDLMETIDKMSPTPFTDVDDTEWYHPYVSSLSAWGLVSGYRDDKGELTGRFEPQRQVTLAETLKIAMEAAQVDTTLCSSVLSHVQARNHWAKAYVGCAEEMDMYVFKTGQPDLNRQVTRAEAISIMSDSFQDPVFSISTKFSDVVNHPLEDYIANAEVLGVIAGDRGKDGALTGRFRPNDQVSRAEISKIIFGRLKIKAARIVVSQK